MSNARHTSPPSLSPSPLLDFDIVVASPSAICKALYIPSCLAIRGQSAVREPGCTTQGGGTAATHIARLLSAYALWPGNGPVGCQRRRYITRVPDSAAAKGGG